MLADEVDDRRYAAKRMPATKWPTVRYSPVKGFDDPAPATYNSYCIGRKLGVLVE
jgi:hypothetical protein